MPVWTARPVSVAPEVELLQWRVMATVPDGSFHFVGRNAATYCGRVSSAIVEFDARTGQGRTFSGRLYRLVGDSGFAGVAEYVWSIYCARNDIEGFIDVTDLYQLEVRQ
ncbi:hypothetical protein QFZ39_006424 [Paraburkholderia graminis]|nr:hypothetical protein [Paraburkholderia graminis]